MTWKNCTRRRALQWMTLSTAVGFGWRTSRGQVDTPQKRTYTYKTVGSHPIKLDFYPHSRSDRRPVIVWIHGGALIVGHRESIDSRIHGFASEQDFALVSIDYRLAPETQLPDLISDIEDAFRWIRDKSSRLKIDSDRIAVAGSSAGGYLTLTSGFLVEPRPRALFSIYGYGDLVGDWYSTPSKHPRHQTTRLSREEAWHQVAGSVVSDSRHREGNGGAFYNYCRQTGGWPQAVSGWDPHQTPEKFYPYMAIKNVTSDYPPTVLMHGTADTDVPYEQSVNMAEQLKLHSVDHELITIPNGEHGFGGGDPQLIEQGFASAAAFLTEHLS